MEYAIFTGGLQISRRRILVGLKHSLSLVSGARSTAIAFPGRPGLTGTDFFPLYSSVMSTSVLSKPNAKPDGENRASNSYPCVSGSRRGVRLPLGRETPAQALRASSARATSGRCAASIFPRKAYACNLELGGAPAVSLDVQCGEVFSVIPESMLVFVVIFFF